MRSAAARAGELDRGFGRGGIVVSAFGTMRALAVRRDGRILVGGTQVTARRWRFALARFLPDGRLDRSFGRDGRLTTGFRARSCVELQALVVQPDGRVLAAGRAGCGPMRFALARYRADGRLDRTFSGDGRVTFGFGSACRFSTARAVALQRDGRIVAAGEAGCGRGEAMRTGFALARMRRDGRLDRTFGGDGRVTTELTDGLDRAEDLLVRSDGRIVAAGAAAADTDAGRFALVRYGRTGRLDASFGDRGRLLTGFGEIPGCGPGEAAALAGDRHGRLVVAGVAGCGHPVFALTRHRATGALDRRFGRAGLVVTAFTPEGCSEIARDVAIQRDGKVLAGGVAGCRRPEPRFALARYRDDGTLDPSFGRGGLVTTRTLGSGESCFGQIDALALQSDGGILAVGPTACGPRSRWALVRYRAR